MKNRTEDQATAFREAHGALETWSGVDFEVHQNLTLLTLARGRRWTVTTRRIKALAAIAYSASLYATAEIVHSVRGSDWHRLEVRVDRAVDRLTRAEGACLAVGDRRFVDWIGGGIGHWCLAVSALTARLDGLCLRESVR